MDIQSVPPWLMFLVTTLLIGLMIDIGFRLGKLVRNRSEDEKEAPVSAITGTVLALLAFILAFTFGIVTNRYDSRKELVRQQAITISTAYSRTDFLPEPDRDEAKALFRTYMDTLLSAADSDNRDDRPELIASMNDLVTQLWDMGVAHAREQPESEMLGLYMDSLNSVGDIQALREAVALEAKIPTGIWVSLFALIFLAMLAVGYQMAIARSRRSWVLLLMALAFATVVSLIALLDNPDNRYLKVSQQPLIHVQDSMRETPEP